MMTLPIFAAGTLATSTAPPASHDALPGAFSFSALLQRVDATNTQATSATSGHSKSSKTQTPQQIAQRNTDRNAAGTTSTDATRIAARIASEESSVSSEDRDVEKSANPKRKVKPASVRAAKDDSSKPATAAVHATLDVVVPIPVLPQLPQDAAMNTSGKANLTPAIAKAPVATALASTSQTASVPLQEITADPPNSSISAISTVGSHLAASVPNAEIIAGLIPQQTQVAASNAESLATRRNKLSTQTEADHAHGGSSANPVLASSDSDRTTHAAVTSPHSSSPHIPQDDSPVTASSNQSSHGAHTANARIRTGVVQSEASWSHASSTAVSGTPDFATSITASAGGTAHSSLQSSLQPVLAQPDPAPGQAAAQSAALQSTVIQSATPTSNVLTPTLQGATRSAPPAATTSSQMLTSAQLRVGENNSQLRISVQLPELGKIEVRAVSAHDVTTAHLTAFRSDALPVLAESRAALEQALKSHDVVLGSLDSHASHSQAQGEAGGNPQQHNQHSPASSSVRTSAITEESVAISSTAGLLPDYSSISVLA